MRYIFLLVFVAGCSMKAGPVEGPPISYCKDFRDDELFSFHLENIIDPRIQFGTGDQCLDVIDDDGRERQLCKSHETFLKCQGTPFASQAE